MDKLFIIAVDGPAGAGKSSVCSDVAKALDILHLDTGATYRTLALGLVNESIDIKNVAAVESALERINVEIEFKNGKQVMLLNGTDVGDSIRTNEISAAASACSAIPKVREKLVELQRMTANKISMIVDGRDIGTCVFPNTPYKFYITASVEERARRRKAQLEEKGISCDFEELKTEIAQRDHNDMTRDISPLKQADDAIFIDTTEMTQQEVVDKIINLIKNK